ncbi:MAG: GntR family transcriptional regulator [Janthinobacterium lividum]
MLTNSNAKMARFEDIASSLKDEICSGRRIPGSWLKQADLVDTYSVPRIEIRKALDWLANRGFVEHVSNKGYRIATVSDSFMKNVIQTRAILESAAVRLAIDNIDDELITRLEGMAQDFKYKIRHATQAEQEQANLEFHRALIAPCGNDYLVSLVTDLRQKEALGLLYRRMTLTLLERDAEEHLEMVRCIRRKDPERCEKVIYQHIIDAIPNT